MNAPVITLDEQRVDALRELANIGAGNASIALERLVGKPIEVGVPRVELVPVATAVAAAGNPDEDRYGIVVPIGGDLEARVLILLDPHEAERLYEGFGFAPGSPEAFSMLAEAGNILCSYYVGSLATAAGLEVTQKPPQLVSDMLAAIFGAALVGDGLVSDPVLLLESVLAIEGRDCALKIMLIPKPGAIEVLLGGLRL